MTSLYLTWVDFLEAHTRVTIHLTDEVHKHGLEARMATHEAFMRLWFPWF
jgi:hypothetical protein